MPKSSLHCHEKWLTALLGDLELEERRSRWRGVNLRHTLDNARASLARKPGRDFGLGVPDRDRAGVLRWTSPCALVTLSV